MDSFTLSKKTYAVIDNFTSFLSSGKNDQRKIRITPDWLEFKISGIVGFYDCAGEGNTGFQEIIIADSKKFLDLISKIGLENAQYKEPFLYLKNGDTKVKYHTSPISSSKPVDKKIIKVFEKIEKEDGLIIEPFELDTNELSAFLGNVTMLGYNYIRLESKNNSLKIIGYDSNGVDAGFYEENINIKITKKVNVAINKKFLSNMFKGNYKISISEHLVKFESLDIKGLMYFLSTEE